MGTPSKTKAEVNASVDAINRVRKGKVEVPHLEELAQLLVEVWGGKRKFVRALKRIYDKAPDGSLAQQRIMEGAIRVVVAAGKIKSHDVEPDELLTTEQVERKLKSLLRKLQPQDDGTQETTPDSQA